MAKRGFWHELKRRHVDRVAVAYAMVGWLLIEVATQVFPVFHMPDWADQLVVLLIIIGFPIALIFAWAFEMTPEGVRRTEPANSEAARPPEQTHSVGKRLNVIIIGVLVLAVAVLLWQKFTPSSRHAEAAPALAKGVQMKAGSTPAKPEASGVPAKSIAVSPFENLNVDQNDAYFVAGMQDLILTKLADIGDLKVISRTSTMQYESHPEDLKIIGQQLGVAKILEGSVQKAGDQVLINVQLIDAHTDAHIWAQSYQRTLNNVFGVEGEVAEKVANALNAKLTAAEAHAVARVPTQNAAAYDAYLRGLMLEKNQSSTKSRHPLRDAERFYAQAVKLDPNFALAWAHLAYVRIRLYYRFIDRSPAFLAQAKQAVDKALQLQPNLGEGYLVLAQYYYLDVRNLDAAIPPLKKAQQLLPNSADVLVAMSDVE